MFRPFFLSLALLSLVGCASTTTASPPATSQTETTSATIKSKEQQQRADQLVNDIATAIEQKAADQKAADAKLAEQKAAESRAAEQKASEEKASEKTDSSAKKRGKKSAIVPVKLDQKAASATAVGTAPKKKAGEKAR